MGEDGSLLDRTYFKTWFTYWLSYFLRSQIFSTAAIILSPLGETIVAAHQIAMSVTSQLFMIPMSLAIALTIRVGTYYGEENWEAMTKSAKLGLATGTVLALMTMLLIALFVLKL